METVHVIRRATVSRAKRAPRESSRYSAGLHGGMRRGHTLAWELVKGALRSSPAEIGTSKTLILIIFCAFLALNAVVYVMVLGRFLPVFFNTHLTSYQHSLALGVLVTIIVDLTGTILLVTVFLGFSLCWAECGYLLYKISGLLVRRCAWVLVGHDEYEEMRVAADRSFSRKLRAEERVVRLVGALGLVGMIFVAAWRHWPVQYLIVLVIASFIPYAVHIMRVGGTVSARLQATRHLPRESLVRHLETRLLFTLHAIAFILAFTYGFVPFMFWGFHSMDGAYGSFLDRRVHSMGELIGEHLAGLSAGRIQQAMAGVPWSLRMNAEFIEQGRVTIEANALPVLYVLIAFVSLYHLLLPMIILWGRAFFGRELVIFLAGGGVSLFVGNVVNRLFQVSQAPEDRLISWILLAVGQILVFALVVVSGVIIRDRWRMLRGRSR